MFLTRTNSSVWLYNSEHNITINIVMYNVSLDNLCRWTEIGTFNIFISVEHVKRINFYGAYLRMV